MQTSVSHLQRATAAPTASRAAPTLALNSTGVVTPSLRAIFGDASRWCLLIAATALGMNLSLVALARAGWRPLLLMLLNTVWIAGVALIGAYWLARH